MARAATPVARAAVVVGRLVLAEGVAPPRSAVVKKAETSAPSVGAAIRAAA
jgi:hypothetical protein